MKKITLLILAISLIPAIAQAQEITAKFIDIKGNDVGTATLTQAANGTLINLDLHNLPAGEHALHFHQKGDCTPVQNGMTTDPKNYFINTGDHLNPHKHDHGFMQAKGPHAGDIPNIIIPEGGALKTQAINERVSINPGENQNLATLLDEDGAAIIIHEGADDYTSQPSGAAGNRIACAVLKK